MIREDHLLRKRVRQFYVIKAICLHKQNCHLDDLIEFANVQAQIDEKEKRWHFFRKIFYYKKYSYFLFDKKIRIAQGNVGF